MVCLVGKFGIQCDRRAQYNDTSKDNGMQILLNSHGPFIISPFLLPRNYDKLVKKII
jgi:hypothetical protein